jgi:transcriptional regulator with PAS, ATPase and Fis domain
LSELSDESCFRKDLIYRINTVEIILPPLRKRKSDIMMLARYFSRLYSNKYMKPSIDFDESAEQKLLDYHYPGNIRELQYIIERAVIMSDGDVLRASDLTFSPIESASEPADEMTELKLSTVEKSTILRVIEKHHGNISRAAKELGLTRTALYRRLSKYNI